MSPIDNNYDHVKIDGSNSRCIAWFKLAELVSRREKEKALSLYRLISHSFSDKAYILQVEGDILWSLEDRNALEKYSQAAYLYKKEKNLLSAAAIYEHVFSLTPTDYNNLKSLVLIYFFLCWPEKFEEKYSVLLSLIDNKVVAEEFVFNFTQNLIDFSLDSNSLASKKLDQEFELESFSDNKFSWIGKSLNKLLNNRKDSVSGLLKKLKS